MLVHLNAVNLPLIKNKNVFIFGKVVFPFSNNCLWRLSKFQALRLGAYWRAAFKNGSYLKELGI